MKQGESTAQLSPEEVAVLEQLRKPTWGCFWTTFLISLPLAAYLIYQLTQGSPVWLKLLFAGGLILIGIVVMVSVVISKQQNPRPAKDLKEGFKKVLTREVENQNIESREVGMTKYTRSYRDLGLPGGSVIMNYCLTIGGKRYRASEEVYMKLRAGDLIEIHMAPNSEYVFYYKVVSSGERIETKSLSPA
jgi:hypothetical protein